MYRAGATGATKFEPVLSASEANKLENIYRFDVLPGNPDKVAVAAKTKTGKPANTLLLGWTQTAKNFAAARSWTRK